MCRMHKIHTFTLRVLNIAAVLDIVALRFCSGKTIPIKTINERPHILTAQNASVSQTSVGIDYCNFVKVLAKRNVLHMLTTSTFVHAHQIFNMCITFPSEALKHTFKKYPSELHQTMKYRICDFLGLRKCASSECTKLCSDFCSISCSS